jgi:hypothetical protein
MKKYRIYIDEVGNNDLGSSYDPNHRYLSLTGVIFELEYVKNIFQPALENLKSKYFGYHPDEPIIFHRKELVNKKFPFNALNDQSVEKMFNQDFLELIISSEFKIISVLIDKLDHNQKYNTWKYDPYHYCMEVLVERFFFYLKSINSVGDVMIESRGGKEDLRLKKSYRKIVENGTHFIESEKLKKLLTSLKLKVKPKMLNIAGLQFADLLAHSSRRFMFRNYNIDEGKKYVFGDEIIEIIKTKYYAGKTGIDGHGIKLLP